MHSRFALALLLLATQAVSAEVLFEAFYRIEKDGKHLGYVVERMSQNAELKTLVTFVYTEHDGEKYYETIRSVAKKGTFAPVESARGGNNTGSRKEVAATFAGGKGWVEIRNPRGRKAFSKEPLDMKKTSFQSSYLFYVADLEKLQKGKNYSFDLYAERLGRPAYGQLSLEGETKAGDSKIQHLVLDLTGETIENFIGVNGDPLGSRSPAQGTIAFWVKTKQEAVGFFEYPNNDLIALFGDLPEGKKNPWYGLANFNAKDTVTLFQKSFGHRKLAMKAREKITAPLPVRVK